MLSLGFSSCPNDTFIFDAIVNSKIDLQSLEFEPFIADVEVLNNRVLNRELDVSKLSFATYLQVQEDYYLLNSGSALGQNCGPLLVALSGNLDKPIEEMIIGIPGEHTTANLLLNHFYPVLKKKKEFLFSDIEEAVIQGDIEAGLIIHENRFTYESKGLKRLLDLGELWEQTYQLPIPLGGIVVKKSIGENSIQKMEMIMHDAVLFAMNNPQESQSFIKEYAQTMDPQVCRQHIDLYVNEFTLDLGEVGKKAIEMLGKRS